MSGFSGNWFSKLFKKASQPEPKHDPGVSLKPTPQQDLQPAAPYQQGDFIGQYFEVNSVLGKGGFGVVYLVYSHQLGGVYALKTFRDEFLADREVRKRFHKEASVWVELGRHPYLVHADLVDELSGRLYIVTEYIAPNEEGLNTLEGYLQRRPPDLVQSLRWAIQVCYGMEYAYSKGLRAHRDLKPANIMITQDETAKITDFGLAGVIADAPSIRSASLDSWSREIALSGQTMLGTGFGTPTHMPPEQFKNAAGCNERSDVYSFGVILFQLASGGRLPFSPALPIDPHGKNAAAVWQEFHRLHSQEAIPRLDSPLMPIIAQCLAKRPSDRYASFEAVRTQLEHLLKERAGQTLRPPRQEEERAFDFANRGYSFNRIGRFPGSP